MISTLKEMSKNCEAVKLQNWRFIGVYLVVDIPLWQIWVSQLGQLGLLFPIYIYIYGKWKMFQTTNQLTLVLPHSPALRGFSIQAVCSHSHGLKFPGWTILDGHHLLRAGDIAHNKCCYNKATYTPVQLTWPLKITILTGKSSPNGPFSILAIYIY